MTKLGKKEMDIVKELIEYSYRISKMYRKLYNLEINGKKNSNEYNNILDLIDDEMDKENKLYNLLNNPKDYLTYFQILNDEVLNSKVRDDSYLFENINNYIVERIEIKLSNLIDRSFNEYEIPLDSTIEDMQFYYQEFFEDLLKDVSAMAMIKQEKLAEETKNTYLINDFKRTKYVYAYLEKLDIDLCLLSKFNLEEDMINIEKYKKYPDVINYMYICVINCASEALRGNTNKREMYMLKGAIQTYFKFLNKDDIKSLANNLNIGKIQNCDLEAQKMLVKLFRNELNQ